MDNKSCLLVLSVASMLFCGADVTLAQGLVVDDPNFNPVANVEQTIKKYEASKAEIYPGDNFPRLLRLAAAYMQAGTLYLGLKRVSDAEVMFNKALRIIRSNTTSDSFIDMHRYHTHALATTYLHAGNLPKAQDYIDESIQIARSNKREQTTLPGLLSTQAEMFVKQKRWSDAERVLLEAVKSKSQDFSFAENVALSDVYIQHKQFDKAREALQSAKNAKYKDDIAWLCANARLMRATGNTNGANELEAFVKKQETRQTDRAN